jgi:alpha-methylacyl-CoA racemase
MMLADMGADVVRVERLGGSADTPVNSPLLRNRRSLALDLKQPAAVNAVLALVEHADVFVEAFRPGVAERLGIGPEQCLLRNSRIVYARMTGWGQTGPLAQRAGHDLNYLSLTGILHQIGPTGGKPVVPLNVIGDFGGGGLLMAYGVVCALHETSRSGKGQVIDAAMIDGALSFMSMFFGYRECGLFPDETGTQLLGGGAHYYDVYETADGKHMAVAPIEPQFYRTFIDKLALDPQRFLPAGYPQLSGEIIAREWPALKRELQAVFKTKSRDEWAAIFGDSDTCVTPVLSLAEAEQHPHLRARDCIIDVEGIRQQAPAPRFSRTPASPPTPPPQPGSGLAGLAADWDIPPEILFGR